MRDLGEPFLSSVRLPLLPEIQLMLASEVYHLWRRTEIVTGHEMPLPYWAFAWSGGQGLARFVLDQPHSVRGKAIVDVGSGSGLVAIAAAKAGATRAAAVEPDAFALDAIAGNAELNRVVLEPVRALSGLTFAADVVLAGDVFYERQMAREVVGDLRGLHCSGAEVVVGDPGRRFLPHEQFERIAAYDVPVMAEVEEGLMKHVEVLRLVV